MLFRTGRQILLAALAVILFCAPEAHVAAAQRGQSAADGLSAPTVAEADSLLRAIDGEGAIPAETSDHFLSIIERAGEASSESDPPLVVQYVAQSYPLLPDSLKRRVASRTHRTSARRWNLTADAGQVLGAWWRSVDPMPASPRNERIEEHVVRVNHSLREYGAETVAGYDDRGAAYVRFGKPFLERTIDFRDGSVMRDIFRFGVPVTLNDFNDNEIWLYRQISPDLYFIFVSDRGDFKSAGAMDILPRVLRRSPNSSERSMNIAASSLAALRHVFGRLALLHSGFGARYSEVDNYAMWQEERRMARQTGAPLRGGEHEYVVGAGATGLTLYSNPVLNIEPIHDFIQLSLSQAMVDDLQAETRREEISPHYESDVSRTFDFDPIPLGARHSRFLREDGSTEVIVDWAPRPGALSLGDRRSNSLEEAGFDQYRDAILQATMLQFDRDFRSDVIDVDTFAIADPREEASVIPPQTFRVPMSPDGARLGVQLDRYVAHVRRGPPMRLLLGPRVQVAVSRSEPIAPLSNHPSRLEMSDLRPLFAPVETTELAVMNNPLQEAEPFPFEFAPSQGSLILLFDIYNLVFGADDRTHYSIEYEVARRDPQGGIRGLLGRTRLERTAARTDHEGSSRRANEFIVLDPAEWTNETELVLTVRVTDESSGQHVERSLTFGS